MLADRARLVEGARHAEAVRVRRVLTERLAASEPGPSIEGLGRSEGCARPRLQAHSPVAACTSEFEQMVDDCSADALPTRSIRSVHRLELAVGAVELFDGADTDKRSRSSGAHERHARVEQAFEVKRV